MVQLGVCWNVMSDYIISIDSGGTHTMANAISMDGQVLATATAGFGNPMVDSQQGIENIMMTIESLLEQLNNHKCCYIILGIAGIDAGDYRPDYQHQVNHFGIPVTIMNDAQLAYWAKFKGQSGVLVIAGTGSVAVSYANNQWIRSGGWGHLIDSDPGSAYWIGMQAVKKVLVQIESNQPVTEITEMVCEKIQCTSIQTILAFIYSQPKSEIAKLAVEVAKLAESGTIDAIQILKDAGKNLGIMTSRLLDRSVEIRRVSESGTVFEKNELVRTEFEKYLTSQYQDIQFIREEAPAVLGGFYKYQNSEVTK